MNKQMSCIAAKTMLTYVGERLGVEAAEAVASSAGLTRDYLMDEHHWMSFAAAQAMSEKCKELLSDPSAPYTIALQTARLRTVGPVLAMARALGSPRAAFRASPLLNRQFTRVVEMEVPELEEGRARVHVTYDPSVTAHRNDCLYRQGVLAGIPTLWGLPVAKIEEEACASRGDARCTYRVTWIPLASRSRPLLLVVFSASGFLTLAGMWLLPRASFVLAPLAVAVLSLLGLRLDRLIRRVRAVTREEFSALEAQLAVVEAQGDDLLSAKEALEERVAALDAAATHVRDLSATLEMEELVRVTLQRLGDVAAAHEGLLAVPHGPGSLRVVATYGTTPPSLVGSLVEPSGDEEGWARAHAALSPAATVLTVPLHRGEERKGVALLGRAAGTAPVSAATREVLALLAAQAAIALENARLYELAITDGLTGLYIHRHFLHRLEHELARLQRFGGTLSLLMIDLDHFKTLNDNHGHLMGDRVLREAAAALRSNLRAKVDIVARYGGEEFAVILPETDEDGGLQAAEKLRRSVAALRLGSADAPISLTCSIGVAVARSVEPLAADTLIGRADDALYEAKKAGRDRVVAHGRRTRPPSETPPSAGGSRSEAGMHPGGVEPPAF